MKKTGVGNGFCYHSNLYRHAWVGHHLVPTLSEKFKKI